MASRVARGPFRSLKADAAVLSYIGNANASVAACLQEAAAGIKDGSRELMPTMIDGLFFMYACQHLFAISVTRDAQTAVISELCVLAGGVELP